MSCSGLADEFPKPWHEKDGKVGFANSVGVYSISPQFDNATDFNSSGIARIKIGEKVGLINAKGEIVASAEFDDIDWPMNSFGLTRFRIGGGAFGGPEGRYGFINNKGQIVIPAKFEFTYDFSENGLCMASTTVNAESGKPEKKWGYIDSRGEFAIAPIFDMEMSFEKKGFARVILANKWGVINAKGDFVVKPKFDGVAIWPDGNLNEIAVVKLNGKWHWINSSGDLIALGEFDWIEPFDKNGLARVYKSDLLGNKKIGFMNTKGEFVFNPQFDSVNSFVNGFAVIQVGSKFGYIDIHGKVVIKPQFELPGGEFDKNGVAKVYFVKHGDKVTDITLEAGFMNKAGEWIIKPNQFGEVHEFNAHGLALAYKGGKFGFVDTSGTMIIGWLDDARDFSSNGLAAAKRDGKFGYIDLKGDFAIAPQFEDAMTFGPNNLAGAKQNGRWGFIDMQGNFAVQPKFDAVSGFNNDGFAQVKLNGKLGYISLKEDFKPAPESQK
jgi:hypothetical protein